MRTAITTTQKKTPKKKERNRFTPNYLLISIEALANTEVIQHSRNTKQEKSAAVTIYPQNIDVRK